MDFSFVSLAQNDKTSRPCAIKRFLLVIASKACALCGKLLQSKVLKTLLYLQGLFAKARRKNSVF